jgi:hypothetical protein
MARERARSEPLSGEDLGFWWGDQPRQRTTMAMLLLLDRRPHSDRLRAAMWRAVEAVPRLRQRVVDAPFDLARPRWQDDPTFDLDFHVRRYAVTHDDGSPEHATLADLFRTLGPIYERPFDRSRPLWELIELDGPGEGSALFFRLHPLVPINLRPRAEQGLRAGTGNRATGVMVRLPLSEHDPIARFHEIHRRVTERKAQPLVEHLPAVAELLAVLPRPLFRYASRASSQAVNLIVTNVPGVLQPRYVAGARITAAYPFAPLAPRCPVSIALYGYDQRLYVGIDADRTALTDLLGFEEMLRAAFEELIGAAARSG